MKSHAWPVIQLWAADVAALWDATEALRRVPAHTGTYYAPGRAGPMRSAKVFALTTTPAEALAAGERWLASMIGPFHTGARDAPAVREFVDELRTQATRIHAWL